MTTDVWEEYSLLGAEIFDENVTTTANLQAIVIKQCKHRKRASG
jgi:hypothetical protein